MSSRSNVNFLECTVRQLSMFESTEVALEIMKSTVREVEKLLLFQS
jgi:hypothetical protein